MHACTQRNKNDIILTLNALALSRHLRAVAVAFGLAAAGWKWGKVLL